MLVTLSSHLLVLLKFAFTEGNDICWFHRFFDRSQTSISTILEVCPFEKENTDSNQNIAPAESDDHGLTRQQLRIVEFKIRWSRRQNMFSTVTQTKCLLNSLQTENDLFTILNQIIRRRKVRYPDAKSRRHEAGRNVLLVLARILKRFTSIRTIPLKSTFTLTYFFTNSRFHRSCVALSIRRSWETSRSKTWQFFP